MSASFEFDFLVAIFFDGTITAFEDFVICGGSAQRLEQKRHVRE
jgi:hypothetical protein